MLAGGPWTYKNSGPRTLKNMTVTVTDPEHTRLDHKFHIKGRLRGGLADLIVEDRRLAESSAAWEEQGAGSRVLGPGSTRQHNAPSGFSIKCSSLFFAVAIV